MHSRFVAHDSNDVKEVLQCISTRHQGFFINGPWKSRDTQFSIGPLSFVQVDYGTSFLPFLEGVDARLLESSAVLEPFRCFFLHLGVGTGTHPFALQQVFRRHCEAIRDEIPEDIRGFHLESIQSVRTTRIVVGEENNFVDSFILCACWPGDFDNVRVLILIPRNNRSGRGLSPTFVLFDPSNDTSNARRIEVVVRFNDGHYTMLQGQTIADIQRTHSDAFDFQICEPGQFLHNGQWQPGQTRCSFRDLEMP